MKRQPERVRRVPRPTPLLTTRPCLTCGADARSRWPGDPWVHAKKPESPHSAKVAS